MSSLVTRSDPARVTYSCVKGYRLEGAAERLCLVHEGGRWEGEPPTCVGASQKETPFLYLKMNSATETLYMRLSSLWVSGCTKPSRYNH